MLEVTDLNKRFGGLVAVRDLSFRVARNTVLGLIGVNGAGKTTVMNCINGLYDADSGTVVLDGRDISRHSAHDVAHAGLGRTFQVPRVFRRMTLVDNLLATVLDRPESDRVQTERAEALLDQVQLYRLRHNYAEELSGGQQKLLELARVMMFDPPFIMLDEPFAGVNPQLCKLFIERVEAMVAGGKTFLLVSHDLTSIYRLCRRILVLKQGQRIAEGSAQEIRQNSAVVEAYLGT
jgi:branched-chain amino acid transport system ATP-binding protein